ncbi:MAG: glycosyltransferase [Pirellulales bacterium]|nr:glycosyltransferase [Pirellulales bacterium]
MKIAYLVNRYPTTSHTFIRREIIALEQLGFEVSRISIRDTRSELVNPEDAAEADKTRVVLGGSALRLVGALLMTAISRPTKFAKALIAAVSLSRRGRSGVLRHLAYLAEACVVRAWLSKDAATHVHAHFGTNSTTVAMLTHRLGGPPYSFTVHGPEEFDRPDEISLSQKIDEAKFVVAISSFGRSQLMRWCSYGQWTKLKIIRCGVDDRFLATATERPPAARRLLNIGRLCEQKGQLLLIEAAAILVKERLLDELVLVGDGPLRDPIERQIAAQKLGSRIRLAGWLDGEQIRQELRDSRALVLPSFAEGLPVVIMESLALARPVVSTYVAGIPELVEPGVSGWLVPAGVVKQLADAMREVLSADPGDLLEMGENGRRRVAIQHDVTIESEKLARLFAGETSTASTREDFVHRSFETAEA